MRSARSSGLSARISTRRPSRSVSNAEYLAGSDMTDNASTSHIECELLLVFPDSRINRVFQIQERGVFRVPKKGPKNGVLLAIRVLNRDAIRTGTRAVSN